MTAYKHPERTAENILVVDDYRTMKFDATTIRTLRKAIEVLYSQEWDEVWLDHDLGHFDGQNEDIMPLVRRVEQDAAEGKGPKVGIFIIHSGNPVGRMKMEAALLPWYTVGLANPGDWTMWPDPKAHLDQFYLEELFGAD